MLAVSAHRVGGLVGALRPSRGRAAAAGEEQDLGLRPVERLGLVLGENGAGRVLQGDLLHVAGLEADGAGEGDKGGSVRAERRAAGLAALDRLHGDGAGGEAGVQDRARLVREGRGPQGGAPAAGAGRRGRRGRRARRERVHDPAVLPDGEVEVRVLGEARQADAADRLPGLDEVARLRAQAALGHVAVLGFQTVGVGDDEAVAALRPLHRLAPPGGADGDVGHVVPRPQHAAVRGGQHVHLGS